MSASNGEKLVLCLFKDIRVIEENIYEFNKNESPGINQQWHTATIPRL